MQDKLLCHINVGWRSLFESICMFTFLLLLGKYLEFRARLKASEFTANLPKLLPLTARIIIENNQESIIAAKKLKLGDVVLIKAGVTIPADEAVLKVKQPLMKP